MVTFVGSHISEGYKHLSTVCTVGARGDMVVGAMWFRDKRNGSIGCDPLNLFLVVDPVQGGSCRERRVVVGVEHLASVIDNLIL